MSVSTIPVQQYVDLLFKKLEGVAKTANSTVKGATNESIASPAFLRGDLIWMQSNQITSYAQAIPTVSADYTGANAIQCAADSTVPTINGVNPTWLTNRPYWIPQEFGPTWLPKIFVGPPGAANIEATGTQIFSSGINGVGEYFFDTQAGILNFIGESIPSVLTSGNVVYVSAYQYVGSLGVTNQSGNTTIGNLKIANTTITTDGSISSIYLQPTGNGIVSINTTTGLILPVGNTQQQPANPSAGTVRYNTDTGLAEIYNGTAWNPFSPPVTNQVLNGDGSTTSFTLSRYTTTAAVLVILNGITQTPGLAYSMTPSPSANLVFLEAPGVGDTIDIRFL